MRKLFSSVFVVLILLNVMGYYGLFVGLQYKNERDMIARIDAGAYDPSEAVTIKIPFKAPYALQSETYERVDGDFEQEGDIYRLIRQRLYKDTFHIVCIKDKTGTALQHALADYVKTFSEESSDDDQQARTLPFFIKEYFSKPWSKQTGSGGWTQAIQKQSKTRVYQSTFTSSIVHPPEQG